MFVFHFEMDELYSDLENYNEVHIIEKLRKENRELKLKLEENEKAMGKLQREFDILDSEFNRLQINYSSLLKTARAEVERKAQLITQLNLDKDMRIIQNRQNRILLNNRSRFKKVPENSNAPNIEIKNADKQPKIYQTPKNDDVKNERCEISSVSTNISLPSFDNTKLNIVDKVIEKVEACINRNERKENVPQQKTKDRSTHIRASAISNRRKSAPVDRLPTFSSDDELEPDPHIKQKIRNDTPPTNTYMTRDINRVLRRSSNERINTRSSETSSIDARSYTTQEARDSNSNRSSRYYGHDKYREGDRGRRPDLMREGDKYREFDGTRDRYRGNNKYKTIDRYREKSRESDKYRGRDKYDTSHRYRQKYSPDIAHKRSYRKYQEDSYRPEYGRHKRDSFHYESRGHYTQRSKERQSNYEGHDYDSDRNIHGHVEKSTDKSHDVPYSKRQKLDMEIRLDENRMYHDNDSIGRLTPSDTNQYDGFHASCQSPDIGYLHETHADLPSTMKEIKGIASVPLDDPRVSSKKYILKTENGKPTLYTTVSQNIEMKLLNPSWARISVPVPDALLHHPVQDFTVENIKEIYMNIENPETEDYTKSGKTSDNLENNTYKNNREIVADKTLKDINSKNNVITQQKEHNENDAKVTPSYELAPLKEGNESEDANISKDLPKIIVEEQIIYNTSKKQYTKVEQKQTCDIIPETRLKEKQPDSDKREQSHVISTIMTTVQEDLELSDETSDNFELHEKVSTASKANIEMKLDDSISITKLDTNILSEVKHDDPKANKYSKSKDPDSHKKNKIKRKKSNSKEIGDVDNPTIDKKRSKKDKSSKPKQIKRKFSELFGDTSSLITPEDLGIPATCVPLCEDAQDAVDINIKENHKNTPTEETCDTKNTNNEKYTNITNLKIPNIEDKEVINTMEYQIPRSTNTNILYENLNYENADITKSDIVKTVIISSGVQPKIVLGDRKEDTVKRVADVEVNIQNVANIIQPPEANELRKLNSIKALATSTPHKELQTPKTVETDYSINDCVSNSNSHSKNDSEMTGLAVDQSNTSTQDSYDPPDVRIFVKRRRRGLKRI